MPLIIDGIRQKELFCKNDNCQKFFGWQNIKVGVITIDCSRCGNHNVWRINYSKGQEDIDKIIDMVEPEGGEK